MAYSLDFRKKVLAYCDKTGSISETSAVFQISRNTIYQWLKTGDLNHQVKGTKPRKVDRDKLKNYLKTHPDAYLTEIASAFTISLQPATLSRVISLTFTRNEKDNRKRLQLSCIRLPLYIASSGQCITS